ncbi:ABC transporter permease, partial [Acinetobacter baumannii]
TIHHLEQVCWRAVPIVVLITFLIGCIIAQQGIFHFRQFGADIFVVDMLGVLVLREIGVDTGGSNVQFSINPKDGRMIVIEMNPRVSRSSALASKATGFP